MSRRVDVARGRANAPGCRRRIHLPALSLQTTANGDGREKQQDTRHGERRGTPADLERDAARTRPCRSGKLKDSYLKSACAFCCIAQDPGHPRRAADRYDAERQAPRHRSRRGDPRLHAEPQDTPGTQRQHKRRDRPCAHQVRLQQRHCQHGAGTIGRSPHKQQHREWGCAEPGDDLAGCTHAGEPYCWPQFTSACGLE